MKILNLGCGTRTSVAATNIDGGLPVRLKASRYGDRLAPLLLRGERLAAYDAMRGEVLRHDLRQGIPFPTGTVDAVYHSELLPQLDRDAVPGLLEEIHRVLRPGGVHRVVVPDRQGWDRGTLSALLLAAGFRDPRVVGYNTSAVPFWAETLLDQEPDGSELRPGSLYVEAFR